MKTETPDKAAEAREIRDALVAGNTRRAYQLFKPRWVESLDSIPINLHSGLIRHVLVGDPVGQLQAETLQVMGLGNYTDGAGCGGRENAGGGPAADSDRVP